MIPQLLRLLSYNPDVVRQAKQPKQPKRPRVKAPPDTLPKPAAAGVEAAVTLIGATLVSFVVCHGLLTDQLSHEVALAVAGGVAGIYSTVVAALKTKRTNAIERHETAKLRQTSSDPLL